MSAAPSAAINGRCCHPHQNRDIIMFHNSSVRRRALARVGIGIGATVAAILALPGIAPGTHNCPARNRRRWRPSRWSRSGFERARRRPAPPPGYGSPCRRISRSDRSRRHRWPGGRSPPRLVNSTSPSRCSASSWTPSSRRSPGPPLTVASVRARFKTSTSSLGQLPESGELVFNALQTYSSSEKVARWVSTDPSSRARTPAPNAHHYAGRGRARPRGD